VRALGRLAACVKAGVAVALAFFVSIAHAHYDGDVSQEQHIYKCNLTGCTYQKTAQDACQQRAGLQNGTVVSLNWSSSGKVFVCTIQLSASQSTQNISEEHCDGWQRGHETQAGSIVASCILRSDACAISAYNHTESWDSNRTPFGFTVPDQDGLPAPWDDYRGCSFKLQGFTPNGECTRVNYTGTGAQEIDEDAGPGTTAVAQGNPYSSTIPGTCDPATGDTTDNAPQASSSVCAQRAGSGTHLQFEWNDDQYTDPPDPPAWSCVRGCKAVPRTTANDSQTGEPIWDCFSLYEAGDNEAGFMECEFTFPFEDQPNYGICQSGTEAPSVMTPRGDDTGGAGSETPGTGTGSGNGTDVSGVEDRLDQIHDALTQCDTSRGDICAEGDVSGELERGEPGLEAMDGVANGGMGQSQAAALDDNAPAWSQPLTGWASGAGAGCVPLEAQVLGTSFSLDWCDWAERCRIVLFWVFNVLGAFYVFGVWQRAAQAT
jgi:hypothetical protein